MRTQVIYKNVFTFDELSDDAKQKVCMGEGEHVFYDFVYEDIVRMAEILGIEIDTRPVKLMGGGTRQDPCGIGSLLHRHLPLCQGRGQGHQGRDERR